MENINRYEIKSVFFGILIVICKENIYNTIFWLINVNVTFLWRIILIYKININFIFVFILMIDIIVAYDFNFGIGYEGTMPWHFKKDLKHFSNITKSQHKNSIQNLSRPTKQNILIMGRKTFDSLPLLLQDRFHIVISSQAEHFNKVNEFPNQVYYIDSISYIIDVLSKEYQNRMNIRNKYLDHNNKIFLIGGGKIYEDFLNNYTNKINTIYVTHIYQNYECDTFFPNLNDYEEFQEDDKYCHHYEENNVVLSMKKYINKNIIN